MDGDRDYPESIEGAQDVHRLAGQAAVFLENFYDAMQEYREIAEAFLNPENFRAEEDHVIETDLTLLQDEVSVDELDHEELYESSQTVSQYIEEERRIRSLLERVEPSEVSTAEVVEGETLDTSEVRETINSLIDRYGDAEKRLWDVDMRLRGSEKTDLNLVDMRLERARRDYRRNEEDAVYEGLHTILE